MSKSHIRELINYLLHIRLSLICRLELQRKTCADRSAVVNENGDSTNVDSNNQVCLRLYWAYSKTGLSLILLWKRALTEKDTVCAELNSYQHLIRPSSDTQQAFSFPRGRRSMPPIGNTTFAQRSCGSQHGENRHVYASKQSILHLGSDVEGQPSRDRRSTERGEALR